MKLNPLHVSLGISVLFHSAVVSTAVLGGFGSRPPLPPPPKAEEIATLILMAAPEAVVETQVAPVLPAPVPPVLEPEKIIAPVPPPEKVQPVPVAEIIAPAPVVAAAPPPPQKISGDGSSPKPGLDLTTTPPKPPVEAHPNYLKNPEPPYPATARRRHQEGLVLLAVKVSAQGRAISVEIKKTSQFPLLDEAAKQAVSAWEFTPAKTGALAVESDIEVPVRFQLKD